MSLLSGAWLRREVSYRGESRPIRRGKKGLNMGRQEAEEEVDYVPISVIENISHRPGPEVSGLWHCLDRVVEPCSQDHPQS